MNSQEVTGQVTKDEAKLIMEAIFFGLVEGVSYAKRLVPGKNLSVAYTIKIDVSLKETNDLPKPNSL